MDGIINVYKEPGYTSFDVVAKLRGILKQKKIGHTGTLDPMAEGVLLVCLGKATKLVDIITHKDKEYKASMRLGITTDTEDITGRVINEVTPGTDLTEEEIRETVLSFVGDYEQLPPMYSAIKKDGKKLYEYARQGIEVEREKRPVSIFSIENIKINIPDISFDVKCSKGTYIRSLCRDIGEKLGCGGTLTSLIRSEVCGYTIDTALKLSEIEERMRNGSLEEYILPLDALLLRYPKAVVKDDYVKGLSNGNKLPMKAFDFSEKERNPQIIRVYKGDEFVALYQRPQDEHIYKPYKMFMI
ncbi:MAG: tRNA pseudouridine(55) synthase TruB [Wujia sp.]